MRQGGFEGQAWPWGQLLAAVLPGKIVVELATELLTAKCRGVRRTGDALACGGACRASRDAWVRC